MVVGVGESPADQVNQLKKNMIIKGREAGDKARPHADGVSPRMNRDSHIPLYHQVYVYLRDRIFDGTYQPKDAVPSENELIRLFGISRITAKRALNELATRGLVVRERGRGSRVVGKMPHLPLLASVEGLLENNLIMGLETEVDLLEFDYVPAPGEVAAALGVGQGETVQMAIRVRKFNGHPFSHLTTYLPEDVGRSFERQELQAVPLLLLLERSGIKALQADQSITALVADAPVAQALKVTQGDSLLKIQRIVYDENGRPVEFITALYVPELYQYRMKLTRVREASGNRWTPAE